MRRIFVYAATPKDEAQRRIWQFMKSQYDGRQGTTQNNRIHSAYLQYGESDLIVTFFSPDTAN
jgi:hypothetical protein